MVTICGEITCGIPQVSVSGPLLFITYINDLSNVSKCLPFSYLQMMLILIMNLMTKAFNHVLDRELLKVKSWLEVSKIALNIKKTNFIIFCSTRKCPMDHVNKKIWKETCV